MSTAHPPSIHKIWFTHTHYIEIDESGYLMNLCLEGAMGYVVRVSASPGHAALAWKIPRMVGDSLRENGYIAQLLQNEGDNVSKMEDAHCDSILGGQTAQTNPFIAAIYGDTGNSAPCRADQPSQRLLICFEKGKRLRICTIDLDARVAYPAKVISDHAVLQLEPELLNAGTLYYRKQSAGAPDQPSHWAPINHEAELEKESVGWYCGLPSVLYSWAQGTLQEAISNGRLEGWSIFQHYTLIKRVLSAVVALHERDLLHGDLRPANIMYMTDPENPETYKVTDYGSFSSGAPLMFDANAPVGGDGRTVLQAIQNARVSAFYAPERRNGFEHEEADRALILKSTTRGSWIIVLGWRQVFEQIGPASAPSSGQPGAKKPPPRISADQFVSTVHKMFEPDAAGHRPSDSDSGRIPLRRGDRIRLREYVFRVEDVAVPAQNGHPPASEVSRLLEKCTVLRCIDTVWKVFNERLIVQSMEFSDEFHAITSRGSLWFEASLPKVVELYQWSKATDIYSVGVLMLYTCFPRWKRRSINNRHESHGDRVIEREFFVLLEHLANPLYFKQMWTQVQIACAELERLHDMIQRDGGAPADFPGLAVDPRAAKMIFPPSYQDKRQRGLYDTVKQTVNNICETTPNARLVLEYTFGWNIGVFLLFMQFIFACLHRQVDVRTTSRTDGMVTGEIDDWLREAMQTNEFPFAFDRIDEALQVAPASSEEEDANVYHSAQRALARVETLLKMCTSTYMLQMVARKRDTEIADYKPVSQTEILLANSLLKKQFSELLHKLEEFSNWRATLPAGTLQRMWAASDIMSQLDKRLVELQKL